MSEKVIFFDRVHIIITNRVARQDVHTNETRASKYDIICTIISHEEMMI